MRITEVNQIKILVDSKIFNIYYDITIIKERDFNGYEKIY